jgi:hypothetical protein
VKPLLTIGARILEPHRLADLDEAEDDVGGVAQTGGCHTPERTVR